tara:strand:+ start:215 stop:427 length:213 start_codon:yes stop_codon:yes gene_type:complete
MKIEIEINEVGISFTDLDSNGKSSNYKFFFFGSYDWGKAPIGIEEILTEGASQLELKLLRSWCLEQTPIQ